MAISEFQLIEKYFQRSCQNGNVVLGIGDDAAVIGIPEDHELLISTDTLVAGTHFFPDVFPADLGYKSLAVNLSDIAAMGGTPEWFTLSLTLPEADNVWLTRFAEGMFELADEFHIDLVGGDTTRGPISVGITIGATAPVGTALRRSGARPGDFIYVTGSVGDAALVLQDRLGQIQLSNEVRAHLASRLDRPQPRVSYGELLRGKASACIDVSDGLAADLQHILESSEVGAEIRTVDIPVSEALLRMYPENQDAAQLALNGGDDYELCFCVSPENAPSILAGAEECSLSVTQIGVIQQEKGLRLLGESNTRLSLPTSGYQHF